MQGPPSHGSRLLFPLGHLGFEPCHHVFPLGHLGFEPCHHVFPANNGTGVVAGLGFILCSLGDAPTVVQQLQDPRIYSKTPSTPIDAAAAFFDCARSCSQWFTYFTRLSVNQM